VNFTPVDWAIVVGYLVTTLAVGLVGKRYVGTVSHYLVAGRELGLYVGIATLAATEIGTITFMYNGELGYKYGFAAFAAALISGLVMIVVGRTGLVVERFRALRLMTVPEYFERKYSRGLRLLAGILVAIGGICRMSDDLETSLRGRAAHATGNNIELAALPKLADSQNHPESREAVASLELRQADIEKSQGSRRALGQRTARFSWARPLDWMWRQTSTKYGTTT